MPSPTGGEPVRCHRCGAGTTSPRQFRRRWLLTGRHHECPTCSALRRRRNGLALTVAVVLCLPAGLLAEALGGASWAARLAIVSGSFYLVLVVQTVVHEAGHALAGRVLGFRIPRVVIGEGRPVFERRLGDTAVEVREIPVGGATWGLPRSAKGYRLRQWLVVAAGLGATALVGIVALRWHPTVGTPASFLRSELVLSSFLLVALNLVPRRIRSDEGEVTSDGWQLATVPFLSDARVAESVASHDRFAVLEHVHRGELDEALAAADALVAAGDTSGRLLRISALEAAGRWADAAVVIDEVLAEGPPDDETEAWLCNDRAWIVLVEDDVEDLALADEHSARALELRGWSPAVLGTRGAVLVALGRVDEGLELLAASNAGRPSPPGRALNLVWMSLGETARGDLGAARRHLAEAGRTDPGCPLLERAGAALEELSLRRARAGVGDGGSPSSARDAGGRAEAS